MSTPDLDATFAFVDLAGFTAVTEAHGDHQAIAILQAFRARTREVLGRDDEIVKTIGDAVMLRFPTPDDAVVALQELIRREISTPDAVLLPRAGATTARPSPSTVTTTERRSTSPPESQGRPKPVSSS